MKTAPVVMLNKTTIQLVRALVGGNVRAWMDTTVEASDLVGRLSQVLGYKLIKRTQLFCFVPTLDFADEALFDGEAHGFFKLGRDTHMTGP